MPAPRTGRGYITCPRMRADSLPEVTFQPAGVPEIKATPETSATEPPVHPATGGRTGRVIAAAAAHQIDRGALVRRAEQQHRKRHGR